MVELALSKIRRDGGTQSRVGLHEPTILEYIEVLESGRNFTTGVTVFYDGSEYWLADGFHRCAAYERFGADVVDAEVKQGSRREAVLHSVGANAEHGLKRTNADKRRAVELLLRDDEWVKASDRWIAEKCGVSYEFVRKLRPEVSTVDTSTPKAGQDGKTYSPPRTATSPGAERKRQAPAQVTPPVRVTAPPSVSSEPEPNWQPIRVVPPEQTTAPEPPKPTASPIERLLLQWGDLDECDRLAFLREIDAVRSITLDALRTEREFDNSYATWRKTQRVFVGAVGSREQKVDSLVLDGGELAMAHLGLSWASTADTLKQAQKTAAFTNHPDRGGSAETMARINRDCDLLRAWFAGDGQ